MWILLEIFFFPYELRVQKNRKEEAVPSLSFCVCAYVLVTGTCCADIVCAR